MPNRDPQTQPTSIQRQVRVIVWLLLTVSIVIFVLGYFQAQTMSAVRAYVRGEGLWTKAQKNAVIHLYNYLQYPDEKTFLDFRYTLQTNLQDQRARLALQQTPADQETAAMGFLGGGNHPDDIPNMITLFLLFENEPHMKRAIKIWAEADRRIAELFDLANRIQAAHKADRDADLSRFKVEIDRLDRVLNELETDFSAELSSGARWIKQAFLLANILVLGVMLAFAGMIARRIVQHINRTETDLRNSESRFKALYDSAVIGILIWGNKGELYDANENFLNLLGYDRADLESGKLNWRDLTPASCRADDDKAMQQIAEQGYCTPFNKEFINKQGEPVPVFVGGTLMDGSLDQGVAFVVDRTDHKKMEDQLRLSATVLEASRDGILICDHKRKILTVNDAYCVMSGTSKKTLIGTSALLYQNGNPEEAHEIEASLSKHGYWQGDTELSISNYGKLPVRASISAVYDNNGRASYYVAVFSDISARKALERDLKNMAHYDHLTGLANRGLFSDRLDTAIARAYRHKNQCALLFVDLDKFKPVNDQYGHGIGDQLLQQVAGRLRSATRDSDTIGRLGGDEFVIIVEDLTEPAAVSHIAEKVIEQLSNPFQISGETITIGCSIGIAIYPQHGRSGIALTRSADIAMYAAKASTSTHYYIYNSAG